MSDLHAWLVERHPEAGAAQFLTIDDLCGFTWTEDANKALRFARREDGNAVCEVVDDATDICEHIWCDCAASPVERAAGETTHCCEHSEAYTRLAKRANHLERIIGQIALLLREDMTR